VAKDDPPATTGEPNEAGALRRGDVPEHTVVGSVVLEDTGVAASV
jgi:hypothetical protein